MPDFQKLSSRHGEPAMQGLTEAIERRNGARVRGLGHAAKAARVRP